jgi:predicted dehydrogenase
MGLPIQVGVIGAGMIGRHRAQSMGLVPELKLVAVADARQELAQKLAGENASVKVYTDGLALASDPNVQAVVICTPPVSHEKLAVAALKAGKHVLVEKPMGTSIEACQRMLDASEAGGATLACGFNLRYFPATKLARQLLDSGAIGKLDHVRAFHGHRGGTDFGPAWITDYAATGGGSLMDNGIHMIDLVRYFLGDIADAKGFATNAIWNKDRCEDNGYLLMKNADGRIGVLHSSWSEWRGYGWRCELYGTEGFIRFGYAPLHLVHGRREGQSTRTKRHWFAKFQIAERLKGWQWSFNQSLAEDLQQWARAIAQGQNPPISGRDGAEAVRLAKAVELCWSEPDQVEAQITR